MVLFPSKMDTPFAITEMTLWCWLEGMFKFEDCMIAIPCALQYYQFSQNSMINPRAFDLFSSFPRPQAFVLTYVNIINHWSYTISVICIFNLSWFLPNIKTLLLRSKGGEYKRLIRMHVG